MKWRVAVYPAVEGVAVRVLSLPGCWTYGATEQEALANIADAIREYLELDQTDSGANVREIEVAV